MTVTRYYIYLGFTLTVLDNNDTIFWMAEQLLYNNAAEPLFPFASVRGKEPACCMALSLRTSLVASEVLGGEAILRSCGTYQPAFEYGPCLCARSNFDVPEQGIMADRPRFGQATQCCC